MSSESLGAFLTVEFEDAGKGHKGILLPSMLIFTAWDVLLFFLMSVNFRICLSSRLTPFLALAWNLK